MISLSLEASDEQTQAILKYMLTRIYDRIKAAIVSFSMNIPEASDAISRTVVEGSVDIIYIIMGNRVERLAVYFANYIDSERAEINKWIEETRKSQPQILKNVEASSKNRLDILKTIESYVKNTEFESPSKRKWPNVYDRFKELKLETEYRTVYSTLSAQIHIDAEEVLRYMISYSIDKHYLVDRTIAESRAFSRLLLLVSVEYYLRASLAFAICFSLRQSEHMINVGMNEIDEEINQARVRLSNGIF
jgi:hypothetical protein